MEISSYIQKNKEDVLQELHSSISGLSQDEVEKRTKQYGKNTIHKKTSGITQIFLRQFTSNPLIIVLAAATSISFLLGQHISSYYIFALILVSVLLGVWNEYGAEKTIDSLLKRISSTALVIRNDEKQEILAQDLTIGDIVLLSQGSIIPADIRLIQAKNFSVNESALTGESKTVYKIDAPLSKLPKNLFDMNNIAFMGTSVDSGEALGIVIAVGKNTEFGKIAKSTLYSKPATDFEKGLSSFGTLLVKVILILATAIFAINALLGHQFIESLLFSLAIAVGLTPELLPVIVTVSLSHGAGRLAKKKVIAKQLIAIENLGNMDILCTDKTGTLTEGNITLIDYLNTQKKRDSSVLSAALLCNSAVVHHKIIGDAIDVAIWHAGIREHLQPSGEKIDEEPFDFSRKLMYAVSDNGKKRLFAKGSPESILSVCKKNFSQETLRTEFSRLNNNGIRIVALAQKKVADKKAYSWRDVTDMEFLGYLTFLDTPKRTAKEALQKLHRLNITVKVITGDSEIITQKICYEVGMDIHGILLGADLEKLSDEQLKQKTNTVTVFARVTPEQKMRIINALKANGHTVGYLGDGINDIPSLRNADVGISVNSAADIAKDAASIVLLRKSLDVIADGVIEGRKTFNNTIKYILMSTSSNFGNMFSAAGASFFLSFLPMTPVQILLTNGLYDISQLSIPTDNVDHESLLKPRQWDIRFIKNYMIFFGPISSFYDFLTFGVMIFVFHARNALFQTGWFIESIATEILVVFVIRTVKTPFFLSRPGKWLIITCGSIVLLGFLIPFSPLAKTLGFVAPPPLYFFFLVVLISTYLVLVEILKKRFLAHNHL